MGLAWGGDGYVFRGVVGALEVDADAVIECGEEAEETFDGEAGEQTALRILCTSSLAAPIEMAVAIPSPPLMAMPTPMAIARLPVAAPRSAPRASPMPVPQERPRLMPRATPCPRYRVVSGSGGVRVDDVQQFS